MQQMTVKTFMVDSTDLQVKYVVINVWCRNPAVVFLPRQGELAIEALARRIQTRNSLEADVLKLFTDHVRPDSVTVTIN